MKNVIIGKGKLAGKGVYSSRNFSQGEIVIKYRLQQLSAKQYQDLPNDEKRFTHKHRGMIYLYSEPDRFVNHSSDPNTYQDLVEQCDIALRDIRAGEEITTDSSKDDIT